MGVEDSNMRRRAPRRPPAGTPIPPAGIRSGSHGQNSGNPTGKARSSSAQELQARRLEALNLRIAGYTYREIARLLEISEPTAWNDVNGLLKAREAESVGPAREIELERLDGIIRGCFEIVKKFPHTEMALKAYDRLDRAIGRRVHILGINMPVRLDITTTEVTQADLELQELLHEAKVRNELAHQDLIRAGTEAVDAEVAVEDTPNSDG